MKQRTIRSVGWIVLISACWLLAAKTWGGSGEDANIANALVFGVVIYFGLRSANS